MKSLIGIATAIGLLVATPAHAETCGGQAGISIEYPGKNRTARFFRSPSQYETLNGVPTEQWYVEAVRGEAYEIRIRNNGRKRIALGMFIDGVNVIGKQAIRGKLTSYDDNSNKYVVNAGQTTRIKGWRNYGERQSVGQFIFVNERHSIAAQQVLFNDPSKIGTIAIAVYPEADEEEAPAMTRGAGSGARSLGTGEGRQVESRVTRTKFEPRSNTACAAFIIVYDDVLGITQSGISVPADPLTGEDSPQMTRSLAIGK